MPWGAVAGAAITAVAANNRGGSSGGTTQTQSTQEPWSAVQPYLRDLYGRANTQSYMNPFSPYSQQAQNLTAQKALDPNSLTSQSQGVLGNTISGQYLNPSTNPAFAGAVSDALGQAKSAFAGQYGGNAGSNLSNSGYQEGLARNLGAVATNAYANQYTQERQNQMNAMQMAPAMDFANINQLAGVGAAQDNAPWQQYQRLQGILSGAGGGQGTQQTPYYTNPFSTMMGGALGGAALYNGYMQNNPQQAQAPSVPFYTGYGIGGDSQYG